MSLWLSDYGTRPPWPVRLAFFVAGLVALGGTYLATEPEGRLLAYLLQALVLLAWLGGVWPWLSRRSGRRDEFTEVARERKVPLETIALSLVIAVTWSGLVFGLVLVARADLWLGKWFWSWVCLWPSLEVSAYFGARRLRRDGAQAWKLRTVRD